MMKKEGSQYALVTGATSGIGKQIAIELTRRGFKVIACGRYLKALLQLNTVYGMQLYPCDLSKEESIYTLCKDVSDKNITVVVNSAGVGFLGHFDRISDESDDMTVRLNITACRIITKFFARNMKKGVILNVCSAAAFSPEPLMASYASSKAYIYSYSRAIDYELKMRKKPVRVCVLCPGGVNTPFNKKAGYNSGVKGMSAERCAKIAVDGILKGKSVIIPDMRSRVLAPVSRITPEEIVLKIQYEFQKRKFPL